MEIIIAASNEDFFAISETIIMIIAVNIVFVRKYNINYKQVNDYWTYLCDCAKYGDFKFRANHKLRCKILNKTLKVLG